MRQGLFESLTGHFLDNTILEEVHPDLRRTISIMNHLHRMFNTREGSISHLIDYGIPDISEIYRNMPFGVDKLKKAIQRCIRNYEPRIQHAQVLHQDNPGEKFTLVFVISGELTDGIPVRFHTLFTETGKSIIAPWKKQG